MFDYFKKRKLIKQREFDKGVMGSVKELFFPPIEEKVADGTNFFVDYSLDSNLEMVYQDIQDNKTDEMTLNTLNACINKLHEFRKRYGIYPVIKTKSEAGFYMVSCNR